MCVPLYIHESDTWDTIPVYHHIFDAHAYPEPYKKNRPHRLQFFADNVGLFFGVNLKHFGAKDDYAATYERLRCFVEVFFLG